MVRSLTIPIDQIDLEAQNSNFRCLVLRKFSVCTFSEPIRQKLGFLVLLTVCDKLTHSSPELVCYRISNFS